MSQFVAKPHISTRGGRTIVEYRVPSVKAAAQLYPVQSYQSYLGLIQESYPGAWQQNVTEQSTQNVLAFTAVFRCIVLISGDISKLRPMLMAGQRDGTNIEVTEGSPFLPVLRKPNAYQTWIQFAEEWQKSKLIYGNTYVLKERDNRGVVTDLYVLDPNNVTPLVAVSGDVYYRLKRDNLAGVDEDGVAVPASEIIHDRGICFWHPLVGVSPIYACGMSAMQGVAIQTNASKFFENMSRPSGVLTAPGKISDETAARLKALWETNFQGGNIGRLAVMGDGLEYSPMTIPPVEAQLIEQLGFTVSDVARAFGVPPYKLGLQSNVTFSNAGQLNQDYYSQCLQNPIFAMQSLLRDGLELPSNYRIWLDLEDLLIMDPLQKAETNAKKIGAGYFAPNEARLGDNLSPVAGGESPMAQQQNFSLAALAKRDSQDDPFGKAQPPAPAPVPAKDIADQLLIHVMPAIGNGHEAASLKAKREELAQQKVTQEAAVERKRLDEEARIAREAREAADAKAKADRDTADAVAREQRAKEAAELSEKQRVEREQRAAEQLRIDEASAVLAAREQAARDTEARQQAERDRIARETAECAKALDDNIEAKALADALIARFAMADLPA